MAGLADQFEKLKQRKELLVILIFLFVIIVFWISFGLFSSQQKSGISAEQKKVSQPLSPSIDSSVIEKLELKKSYSAAELRDFPIFIITESQGEAVLIDSREDLPPEVVLPPEIEGELQQQEEDFGL